jgi:RNA polymerase sigma-70 factor (ECF subfamily)
MVKREYAIEYLTENRNKLLKIAYGYCKDYDSAEDIVQEAIINVLKYFCESKFNSMLNFKKWLTTVVKNKCITEFHKKMSRPKTISLHKEIFSDGFDAKTLNDVIEDTTMRQDQLLDTTDELQKVLRPISKLRKELLYMHYAEGYTISEISQIKSLHPITVRTNLFRSKEIVRKRWIADVR